jgi:hypothetical protein
MVSRFGSYLFPSPPYWYAVLLLYLYLVKMVVSRLGAHLFQGDIFASRAPAFFFGSRCGVGAYLLQVKIF